MKASLSLCVYVWVCVFQKYPFSFIFKCKPGGHVLVSYQFKNKKKLGIYSKNSVIATRLYYTNEN